MTDQEPPREPSQKRPQDQSQDSAMADADKVPPFFPLFTIGPCAR